MWLPSRSRLRLRCNQDTTGASCLALVSRLLLPEPAPVSSHRGTAVPDPDPAVRCRDPERRYRQYSGHPVGLAGAAQGDPLRNWPDTRRAYTELKRTTA